MRVFAAPAEVVTNQLDGRKLRNTAIKTTHGAEQQREFGARFSGQHRVQFAQLAMKRFVPRMKQQGNLIALRVAVKHPQAAVHQMLGRCDHQIAKPFIERSLKFIYFFGEPCEAATIEPRHDMNARQHAMIVRRLEDAHLGVEAVEFYLVFIKCVEIV